MMPQAAEFPYIQVNAGTGAMAYAPNLPITLAFAGSPIPTMGLLDTGGAVNVIPFDLGHHLGLVWEEQRMALHLAGNLARAEARAVFLNLTVLPFPPVRMCFAWTTSNAVPVILGQVNFFEEFDVCFFRSRLTFEVRPK